MPPAEAITFPLTPNEYLPNQPPSQGQSVYFSSSLMQPILPKVMEFAVITTRTAVMVLLLVR
jgi:hypothetical protein